MSFDIIVIGAGISGAGAGYALAGGRRILLLEGESQPGYHSTGRSAAVYEPNLGNAVVRAFNIASAATARRPSSWKPNPASPLTTESTGATTAKPPGDRLSTGIDPDTGKHLWLKTAPPRQTWPNLQPADLPTSFDLPRQVGIL